MRVACYARYSSDLQRETSIGDQLAVARRYATDRGWTIDEVHIYTDAGITGASIEGRGGLEALLGAAGEQPRPFDVVLVDDTSRISRDIADAIRVMQRLKFWGIRVIYLSQGIDSDSDQADALVTMHGLVDNLYLKELAKKVKRGLKGQHQRGYSTGGKTFGYRTVPVIDPSGQHDTTGQPARLGCRIEVNPEEANTIRQVFEWAANGTGAHTIVARLNQNGWVPATGKARWSYSVVKRLLANERYRGLQIYGQVTFERVPGTNRVVPRKLLREQWQISERPDLRIVSDDVWFRAQAARQAHTEFIKPKGQLVRGSNAALRNRHLFTGLARCALCGGGITVTSGGRGSPRFGCGRAWKDGSCSNRLTIRAKVAEPQLLARLHSELLQPATLAYITEQVKAAIAAAAAGSSDAGVVLRKRLAEERRKRVNLVGAIEEGGDNLVVLLTALKSREANIQRLENELTQLEEVSSSEPLGDLPTWVEQQLTDLHGLLKDDPERVKAEFRRLNLHLTFTPVDVDTDNSHYVVNGQCDLSALAFSLLAKADRPNDAFLARSGEGSAR